MGCGIQIDFSDECTGLLGDSGEAGRWVDDARGSDDEQEVAVSQNLGALLKVRSEEGLSKPDNMWAEQRLALTARRWDGDRNIAILLHHVAAGTTDLPDIAVNLREIP